MSRPPDKLDLGPAYAQWVAGMRQRTGERGLQAAIGGQFTAFGIIEREMLRLFGLHPDASLVDVGCGSGRLAIPLAEFLRGPYLGTDIVPELVNHARSHAARPDWRFEVVDRMIIPLDDGAADMVCFFSVLTHLLHEQSYLYLAEARRVLKPGGRIVLSFLEFAMPFHWTVFEATVANERASGRHPLNMFIERNTITLWASKLDLHVVAFHSGDDAFVPLPEPVTLEDGRVMTGMGNLGQSICVLERP